MKRKCWSIFLAEMKQLWCWRCKIVVPMLDENEFQAVNDVYRKCIVAVQEERTRWNRPLKDVAPDAFAPVLAAYFEQTGFEETNPNAVLHHRLALYGPPCHACEKPFRTPEASFCAACGAKRRL